MWHHLVPRSLNASFQRGEQCPGHLWLTHTFIYIFSTDASSLIGLLLQPAASERATIVDICQHWWLNIDHSTTAIQDAGAGKPVDWPLLAGCLMRGSLSSSEDSDSDPHRLAQNDTLGQPIKGILKKPEQKSEEDDEAVFIEDLHCNTQANGARNVEGQATEDVAEVAHTDTCIEVRPGGARNVVVFDSKKKPRKSILKKQRYTGSDSGCIMDESSGLDLATVAAVDADACLCAENVASQSCSSCDTKGSSKDLLAYDLADIASVLESLDNADNGIASSSKDSLDLPAPSANDSAFETSEMIQDVARKTSTPAMRDCKYEYDRCGCNATNNEQSCDLSPVLPGTDISAPVVISRRKKGILKKSSKHSGYDPTWRYSTGSQGSNSSADFLDFSYDSMDGETFMAEHCGRLTSVNITLDDFKPDSKRSADTDNITHQVKDTTDLAAALPLARDLRSAWNSPPPLPSQPPPPHPPQLFNDAELSDLRELLDNNRDCQCLLPGFSPQPSEEDIFCKINQLNCEESQPWPGRGRPTDPFDLADAREVYQQALEICNKVS